MGILNSSFWVSLNPSTTVHQKYCCDKEIFWITIFWFLKGCVNIVFKCPQLFCKFKTKELSRKPERSCRILYTISFLSKNDLNFTQLLDKKELAKNQQTTKGSLCRQPKLTQIYHGTSLNGHRNGFEQLLKKMKTASLIASLTQNSSSVPPRYISLKKCVGTDRVRTYWSYLKRMSLGIILREIFSSIMSVIFGVIY